MPRSGTAIPDGIVVRRHLDLEGRRGEAWARRALVALVALVPLLALSGAFGQRPSTTTAENASARLAVEAPHRLRGGLLYQATFDVLAKRELGQAGFVLDDGWVEGMQVNSVQPEPLEEHSTADGLELDYGLLHAGGRLVVRLQFQVDPTNVGRRSQGLTLVDRGREVAALDRTVTVFP